MMSETTENLVVELKTELKTVVEALSFLHEFVESVFGAKYHNFLSKDSDHSGKDVQTVIKRLRLSHHHVDSTSNPPEAFDHPPHPVKSEVDIQRRESKGDNGYSSAGATPLQLERRWSSTSSKVFSPPEEPSDPQPQDLNRLHMSVDESELVSVKCEVDDSAFLDDVVDNFGDPSDFHYEGEESELRIDNSYPIPSSKPIFGGGGTPTSTRFIPELIPIQSEPVVESMHVKDDTSEDSSVDSESEWRPSTVIALPKKPKRSSLPSQSYSKVGGPFKCDMCPASYKQEESLRSHQKYKHNPSRVQCTCHLCGKSMVDKYRLQRHLRLHTGEKPFECEYCGQSFYRKDYHTKHLQRKHGIHYSSAPVTPKNLRKNKPDSTQAFSNYISNIFETPSPPQPSKGRKTGGGGGNSQPNRIPVSSPSSLSTSPGTSSSQASSGEIPHQGGFDIFTHHHDTPAFTGNGAATPMSNLMTMTSLTFDDLISADL